MPDETTICKFRHLLEQHGMKLSQGTIVDATIIAAAPSTKNKGNACDPEMHQTR